MTDRVRRQLRVTGVVQGVGFRPFAYALAIRYGLAGFVANDGDGVCIEIQGSPAEVEAFTSSLRTEAPALAVIEAVTSAPAPVQGESEFRIVTSASATVRRALVSPDVATCDDCLREFRDPADRRYRYPFVNCTNCGPRFTIVCDVPYDRSATTMAAFEMCAECSSEYDDPADRRFHAQPVCCPACGPTLRFVDRDGRAAEDDPLEATTSALCHGRIVAVKGLGGYHLAALASDEGAVAALRARKHREDKPFAVMVADLRQARELCVLDPAGETVLSSRRAPILLLPRQHSAPVASAVAPGACELGVMLPYTPLHHLLLESVGAPIVLTSGNVSDEPIAYVDADAQTRLGAIADAFLEHDRAIRIRADDSLVRVFQGRERAVRRSRGYAPEPVTTAFEFPRHVLACGAELKNTFCVAKERHAFVSHHVGDLENADAYAAYVESIDHYCRLFDVQPEVVAHDLHPDYLSTKYAEELRGVRLVGVQHHHAHIASCLAEHAVTGPVIGVAYDGLGYGTDGSWWGGEFLVADLADSTRVGTFRAVPMPGGAAAIHQPWRMALAYLQAAYGDEAPTDLEVARRDPKAWRAVMALLRSGRHAPMTSSVGRLFDAVSAVLRIRDEVTYEGQAAVELERHADPSVTEPYDVAIGSGEPFALDGPALFRRVVDDLRRGAPRGVIAGRFHASLAEATRRACERVRSSTGLATVALSGGVWQNVLLLTRTVDLLERAGFDVLIHARVPCNDGGISLGQAAVAAHRGLP